MTTLIQTRKSKPVNYKAMAVDSAGMMTDTDSRKVSGYAAIFGNKDSSGDILIRGCFSKSIQERGVGSSANRKIAFLWQHNMSDPIGRITELYEDEKGLYFEAEIDKIPQGDRALEQMKSGTINQFSIGYKYVWDKIDYDDEKEAFICKELELFELSAVTVGANEETYFAGMKSDQIESEANQLHRDTEKAIKQLPHELQYTFRQLITKHIALAETKPLSALKEESKPQFDLQTAILNAKFIN